MTAANAPAPQIEQKPTRDQMQAEIEKFIAPKGTLENFANAGLALRDQVVAAMYTPEYQTYEKAKKIWDGQRLLLGVTGGEAPKEPENKYATDNPFPNMTPQELENLLIDHYGLSGEFGNGLKSAGMTFIHNRAKPEKLEFCLEQLTGLLEHRSQLTTLAPELAHDIGVIKETNFEALSRVAEQIEHWKDRNCDTGKINNQGAFAIEDALELYLAKLEDVKAFVDKAERYQAPHSTIAPAPPPPALPGHK